MKEYKKPLPVTQAWSREFWESAKEHKLLIQECKNCREKIFYPRKSCPECWSTDLGWSEASGKAKIFTYTTTLTGVEEKFAQDLPFILACVDLEEGIRMMTRIVDCAPETVEIGMEVEVVFEKVTEEFSLPFFRPVR